MTEPAVVRLTDRRRDLVAHEIRRTALALFDRHGFDAVSVQDIAAAAGMAARTFFRYFASKDDVLLDYERFLRARLLDALRGRPDDEGAVTALRNAFIETSTVAPQAHDAVVQRARVLAAAPGLRARAQGERAAGDEDLAAALADRMGVDPRRDQRPLVVAAAMSAAAGAAWDRWVQRGGPGDPSRGIADALDVLVGGLEQLDDARPRKGRRST